MYPLPPNTSFSTQAMSKIQMATLGIDKSRSSAGSVVAPVVLKPKPSPWRFNWVELWEFREVLYFLTWRDMKARYAQTLLGIAWAIIQPLAAMLIFTVVFSVWAKLPSDGMPYPLFAYAALLPWTLLAKSLERSGQSVVTEANLVKKVYFPRIILPIASTLAGAIDFLVAFVLFLFLMIWYGQPLTWTLLLVPGLVAYTMVASLAVSLWLSALNVQYRDVAGAIPLMTQLWMYASPVVYSLSLVPEQWRTLYSLNPMVGIIEAFRWALLGSMPPDVQLTLLSGLITIVLFAGGLVFFNHMSRKFSDVV